MKNNTWALVSFIVSLIGIVILGLPCGMVAVLSGLVGLASFDKNLHKGKWQAIVGLILGTTQIIVMGWLFLK